MMTIIGSPARAHGHLVRRGAALTGAIALTLLTVSSPAAAATPTLGPNLLQNGGFEEPVIAPPATVYGLKPYTTGDTFPGWDSIASTNGYVDLAATQAPGSWTSAAVNPAEGDQFIGLPGFGITGPQVGDGGPSYSLAQQFPTEIGKTYQVSYWVAGGPNVETLGPAFYSTAGVSAGDVGVADGGSGYQDHNPLTSAWTRYSFAYTATTGVGRVQLVGIALSGGVAPLFDGVSVQEVIPAVVDTPIASAPVVLLGITVAGVVLAAVLGWRRRVAFSGR